MVATKILLGHIPFPIPHDMAEKMAYRWGYNYIKENHLSRRDWYEKLAPCHKVKDTYKVYLVNKKIKAKRELKTERK